MAEQHPSIVQEHIMTPATVMTASRPLLAAKVATMLVAGERSVWPYMLGVAASDAEGNVARLIDRVAPESGYGCTDFGRKADPVADTAALLLISGAALIGPRVSPLAKTAVSMILAGEGTKATWLAREFCDYFLKAGEFPKIKVNGYGKAAMLAKLVALSFATLTNDLNPGKQRDHAGQASIAFATGGIGLHAINIRKLKNQIEALKN